VSTLSSDAKTIQFGVKAPFGGFIRIELNLDCWTEQVFRPLMFQQRFQTPTIDI
jgi:hypothetical protein